MKHALQIFLLLISLPIFCQEDEQNRTTLWLQDKEIQEGDYVDIHDFKKLQVVSALASDQLEIKFVVVPFGMTLLSFTQEVNDLKDLDILKLLSFGKIPVEKIDYVRLNIIEKPENNSLFSIDVSPRKIESAADYYREAMSHATVGNNASATENIEQAIALDPENLSYLNVNARLGYDRGQFAWAKTEFQKIIKIQANYTSYFYLGLCMMELNELKSSLEYGNKALEYAQTNEEFSNAYYLIGTVKYHEFNLERAYDNYKKSLEYNPSNINALNDISAICDDVNRGDEKLAYFKKIIEVAPDFYQVHINVGFYYLKKKKYREALDEFDYVLNIEPDQPLALSNKAFCLYKLGKTEEALKFINKSLEYDPLNSYAYKNRALIYLELKNKKAACEDLNEAIQLDYTARYGDEVNKLLNKWCK